MVAMAPGSPFELGLALPVLLHPTPPLPPPTYDLGVAVSTPVSWMDLKPGLYVACLQPCPQPCLLQLMIGPSGWTLVLAYPLLCLGLSMDLCNRPGLYPAWDLPVIKGMANAGVTLAPSCSASREQPALSAS